MRELSKEEIRNLKLALIKKKFKIFDTTSFDMNIIGVRSKSSISDKFDDKINIIFKDGRMEWKGYQYDITTDPGKHWLLNPLNRNGTLILKANEQYRGMFKDGLHGRSGSSPYRALEQIGSGIYVRDNNRDGKLDFSLFKDPANWIRGVFKTNIHRSSKWKRLFNIGKYSAGCQVFADPKDHDHFISTWEKQIYAGLGDTFTYTLLTEKYLEDIIKGRS